MKLFKKVLLTASVIAVTACSAFEGNNEVERLNGAEAVGSPFTQQLTAEYRAFANYELKEEKDYADALHFARKGLASAEGIVVMPEPFYDWDLSENEIVTLSEAYARLIAAFDRGARDILPGKSAIAQARYDCWVEESEEIADGEPSDVSCQNDFMNVMSEIEAALPAPQAPAAPQVEFPEPVTMIDASEPLNVQEAMYLVFFDFDKSAIGEGGENVINAVFDEIQARNLTTINIVGHTDTSGSDAYNQRLAMRRANAVKDTLVSMGVPAGNITTEGRGESELLVQTADGIREPANRRSVITFQ